MKKIIFSSVAVLLLLLSCSQSDSEEIDNNGNGITTGNDPIEATKVTFTGVSVSSDDQFKWLSFDLDDSREASTILSIENYKNTYSYQLELTGIYQNNVYYVDVKKIESVKQLKTNNVTPSEPTTTVGVDLSNLEMLSDFYTAKLIEINSGNELSLENNGTDTRDLRFIDQGSADFYTTIRASQTSGAISSTGHPKASSIKVDPYQLTKAKAFISPGNTHRLAFYTVADKTFVNATSTITTSQSHSSGGASFYATLTYISPDRIGVAPGDYLVRMELLDLSNVIIKTSPFQSFKIK